jgi:hypothetical protein
MGRPEMDLLPSSSWPTVKIINFWNVNSYILGDRYQISKGISCFFLRGRVLFYPQ